MNIQHFYNIFGFVVVLNLVMFLHCTKYRLLNSLTRLGKVSSNINALSLQWPYPPKVVTSYRFWKFQILTTFSGKVQTWKILSEIIFAYDWDRKIYLKYLSLLKLSNIDKFIRVSFKGGLISKGKFTYLFQKCQTLTILSR